MDLDLSIKSLNINIHRQRGGIILSLLDSLYDVVESTITMCAMRTEFQASLTNRYSISRKGTKLQLLKLNLFQSLIRKVHLGFCHSY